MRSIVTLEVFFGGQLTVSLLLPSVLAVLQYTYPFVVDIRPRHGPIRPLYFPIGVFRRRLYLIQRAATQSR